MNKVTTKQAERGFTYVPVTTMEAVPELFEAERADLLASLRESVADIASGRFTEFAPGSFAPWLRQRVADLRRRKHAL